MEAITAFNLIAARATLLAQGTKLAAGDDRIAIENERLKNLVRRGFFGRTPDFLTFVKLLRRDGSIPAEDSDWVRVVTAIEASDAEPIKAAVRNLSAKLVSESAKQS